MKRGGGAKKSFGKKIFDFPLIHQASLDRQREKMDTEKVEWQEKFMKKQETEILQMERKLKEGARDERDKEIEMVIQRLEREASESREEV